MVVSQKWVRAVEKGSKNREKARMKLVKVYERPVNQRDDSLHKLSRFYINEYDVICLEKLNLGICSETEN